MKHHVNVLVENSDQNTPWFSRLLAHILVMISSCFWHRRSLRMLCHQLRLCWANLLALSRKIWALLMRTWFYSKIRTYTNLSKLFRCQLEIINQDFPTPIPSEHFMCVHWTKNKQKISIIQRILNVNIQNPLYLLRKPCF